MSVSWSRDISPVLFNIMEPAIPTQLEKEKVNEIYEKIAPHFSATRYKVTINDLDNVRMCSYYILIHFPALAARR
jgi:hypothetical protein